MPEKQSREQNGELLVTTVLPGNDDRFLLRETARCFNWKMRLDITDHKVDRDGLNVRCTSGKGPGTALGPKETLGQ
jgi:hypothetical protein